MNLRDLFWLVTWFAFYVGSWLLLFEGMMVYVDPFGVSGLTPGLLQGALLAVLFLAARAEN